MLTTIQRRDNKAAELRRLNEYYKNQAKSPVVPAVVPPRVEPTGRWGDGSKGWGRSK